jgi:deazaflavin-dependent oxidoreductase (nitroreductase family)
VYRYDQANLFHRLIRWSGSVPPISWLYARTLHHIDRVVYRATSGRKTFTSLVTGLPVVQLTTTGARSGLPRTLPVLGVPEGDRLIVIASNFGQYNNPSWYYNLRAQPHAEIVFEGTSRQVEAKELSGAERERWYARGVDIYPGWTSYRRRAAHREIPVIELRPS